MESLHTRELGAEIKDGGWSINGSHVAAWIQREL
jgi:hypothetical protein